MWLKLKSPKTADGAMTIKQITNELISSCGSGQYFFLYNSNTLDAPSSSTSGIINLMVYSSQYYVTIAYPFNNTQIYKKYGNGDWELVSRS